MKDIHIICKEYGIKNYTINEDGSIDVDGDVNLLEEFTELPIKFRNITGHFYCGYTGLKTLEGCPENVGGNFNCINNNLKTLEGSPKYVKKNFFCTGNKLTSLEYSPSFIGESLICAFNRLTTLEGITENIGGDVWCNSNKLTSLSGLEKVKLKGDVFTDYIESISDFLNKRVDVDVKQVFYVLDKKRYFRNIKLEQII